MDSAQHAKPYIDHGQQTNNIVCFIERPRVDNPFVMQAAQCLFDGAPADALRIARMGMTLAGDAPALLEIAAESALQLGDDAGAADCLQRLVALDPSDAAACSNLGIALERLGHPDTAEAAYRQSLAHQPDAAGTHSNLGVLLTDLHREAEAEACFRQALALQPDFARARMNLGQLLLAQGRFTEGWPLHEGRLTEHADPASGPDPIAAAGLRHWQGEALAGKSIIVLPEQGLGDEIQFCRYLPWLKARGAAQVTLVCRPSQTALLQTLAGPDTVISQADALPRLAAHDYWTVLLSLPLHAGTTLETIPADVPYLHPDPARVARLAPLLAGDGLKVGLVWRGNPQHSNDAERSLPGLEVLAPLWAIPGVRFFSLQKDAGPLPPGLPLTDLAPVIADFADSAALLSRLDLLISIDSAPAHLAGALGVPCWLLLPARKTDWRWLRGRDDSPWYPGMRLFRQTQRGDWREPVGKLVETLMASKPTRSADEQDQMGRSTEPC